MNGEMTEYKGSCLCGVVQFCYGAPSLWCAHCHCSLCRRAHGAGFVTWVGVDQERFSLSFDKGLRWYPSSADSERGFCQVCGSTLFFRSKRWAGQVHIARANIDSPIDIEPTKHSYWSTHVDWLEFNDVLPRDSR